MKRQDSCGISRGISGVMDRSMTYEYDLMLAAVSSMTDDNNFYEGVDGFPAFGFQPGSEVKQPYRLYLPEKLPAEFTLVATFKPTSFKTSYYLFAVLNPFETVVQLGIRISDGPDSNQNISLVYTNSDEHSHSEEVAKFTVPKLTKKWSKIVIKVSTSDITFYLNCHEMARQRVTRIPQELVFDTASTLYIAQAGPHIQERYDVSTVHALRIVFFCTKKWTPRAFVRDATKRNKWRLLARGDVFHENRHCSALQLSTRNEVTWINRLAWIEMWSFFGDSIDTKQAAHANSRNARGTNDSYPDKISKKESKLKQSELKERMQQRYEQSNARQRWGGEKLVRCFAGGEFSDKNAPRIFRRGKTSVPVTHPRGEGCGEGDEDVTRTKCTCTMRQHKQLPRTWNIELWNRAGACYTIWIKATVDRPRFPQRALIQNTDANARILRMICITISQHHTVLNILELQKNFTKMQSKALAMLRK
ncbi:hypothetical protein DBV15_05808 [Temnothorax longispinosus]|uniref:Thrombospondin-like N-terminal domain-containing protein n=1 Tax=Temnothorax longispinosus TaxID=300112 RepID=A0A4S2L3F7_9HYME|nr:hypothetical protein DBV15_05808 [Temnothorax longispinosus]